MLVSGFAEKAKLWKAENAIVSSFAEKAAEGRK
jgi:hypothetical protein